MNHICQNCAEKANTFFFAGYIDPGTGYVFSSFMPILFGFITTSVVALFTFFMKRGRFTFFIIALVSAVTIIGMTIFSNNKKNNDMKGKIVILGVDGMDPHLLDSAIKAGLVPNLAKLKNDGYYSELQTTTPPQSPVAWASFATGTDPSKHGVFDFIVRKPQNYQLDLVWMDSIKNAIRTEFFWQKKELKDINTTVLFLPNTFPPNKLNGRMISGMGTPDLFGTAGKFYFFTSKNINKASRGNQISIKDTDLQTVKIPGPKYQTFNKQEIAHIPMTIRRDNNNKQITISIQNQIIPLKIGEFSKWVTFEFSIDFFTKVNGIGKFYLKEMSSDIEIYLSPINFDPSHSMRAISYPQDYSKELSKEHGMFYTQGLPHDTWALEEGILNEGAFLQNADSILQERESIYLKELEKQKNGIIFSYFGITDTISHMFWKNPEVILKYYMKIDTIIGKTLKNIDKQDTLIILSDHGFAGFDWEFNLNSWLRDNGYLSYINSDESGGALLEGVDWENTQAYAIGYNGIYLNMKGREGMGSIDKSESVTIIEKLKKELLSIRNPSDNSLVIKKVYDKKDLNIKDSDPNSPDLFVGYYKGIRSSWDTAVGASPKNIVNKRSGKWAGDHLFDASEVPGVLLSNKKLKLESPQLTDIVPLIIKIVNNAKY